MRCPSEGDLRTLDASTDEVAVHMRTCARCADRLERITQNSQLVTQRLDSLNDGAPATDFASDPNVALQTFKAKLERNQSMTEFGQQRRLRPVFAGGVLIVALMAALLITPVRSAAVGLLDVFRVEKFAVITVDASKMPIKMDADRHNARHGGDKPNPNVFGTYDGPIKLEPADKVESLDAASELAGYEVASAGETLGGQQVSEVYVTQPFRARYTFDVEKIRQKIKEAGVQGVKAPQQLDGKTFTLDVDQGVFVRYGDEGSGVVFAQGPSPELTIPDGVNMDYLRQDFLLIPGLPSDLVAQVQEIEDWERTLVIPVPANGSSQEVRIDGNEGVLISDATGQHNGVLWQRDGRLYAIGGKLTSEEALQAARAVRYP